MGARSLQVVPGEQGCVPAAAGSFLFELRPPRHWAGLGWTVLSPAVPRTNCILHLLSSNRGACHSFFFVVALLNFQRQPSAIWG